MMTSHHSSRRFPSGPNPRRESQAPFRVALAALLAVLGCKGWHVETVPPAELVQERQPEVVRIDRSSDSSQVIIYSPTLVGDSIRGLPTELAIRPLTVPLRDIRSIAVRQFSLGRTLLLGLAVAGGIAAYQLLQSLNTGPTF